MKQQHNANDELNFEAFWEIISGKKQDTRPEMLDQVQFQIVEQDIQRSAASALCQMHVWSLRMEHYEGTSTGRRLVIDSPLLTPYRATVEVLSSYNIFNTRPIGQRGMLLVHALALWLDEVASNDERSYLNGIFTLLSLLRKNLVTRQPTSLQCSGMEGLMDLPHEKLDQPIDKCTSREPATGVVNRTQESSLDLEFVGLPEFVGHSSNSSEPEDTGGRPSLSNTVAPTLHSSTKQTALAVEMVDLSTLPDAVAAPVLPLIVPITASNDIESSQLEGYSLGSMPMVPTPPDWQLSTVQEGVKRSQVVADAIKKFEGRR
jgi:hypothetical protein